MTSMIVEGTPSGRVRTARATAIRTGESGPWKRDKHSPAPAIFRRARRHSGRMKSCEVRLPMNGATPTSPTAGHDQVIQIICPVELKRASRPAAGVRYAGRLLRRSITARWRWALELATLNRTPEVRKRTDALDDHNWVDAAVGMGSCSRPNLALPIAPCKRPLGTKPAARSH